MFDEVRALADIIGAAGVIALAALIIIVRYGPWKSNGQKVAETLLPRDQQHITNEHLDEKLAAGRELQDTKFDAVMSGLDDIKLGQDADRIEASKDRQNLHDHVTDGSRHN